MFSKEVIFDLENQSVSLRLRRGLAPNKKVTPKLRFLSKAIE